MCVHSWSLYLNISWTTNSDVCFSPTGLRRIGRLLWSARRTGRTSDKSCFMILLHTRHQESQPQKKYIATHLKETNGIELKSKGLLPQSVELNSSEYKTHPCCMCWYMHWLRFGGCLQPKETSSSLLCTCHRTRVRNSGLIVSSPPRGVVPVHGK